MTKNNYLKSTPIFLAFLVMGFGDVSGPLTSQLQSDFSLSNFQAGLVTFMAFIMFGLLSVPMGSTRIAGEENMYSCWVSLQPWLG